jgi:hypothetical protein
MIFIIEFSLQEEVVMTIQTQMKVEVVQVEVK